MIDDGYTFREAGCLVRPLTASLISKVSAFIEQGKWFKIDKLLWRAPWFIGDADKLTEDDKNTLVSVMVGFDLEKSQADLKKAVLLKITRPLLANRSCDTCKQFLFDTDTDKPYLRDGYKMVKRESHIVLPCDTREGCPKGHHSDPIHLSEINEKAWNHYLDWRAVGLTDFQRSCPVLRGNWRIMDKLAKKHGI